jgi:hypothetical protein
MKEFRNFQLVGTGTGINYQPQLRKRDNFIQDLSKDLSPV